MNHNDKSSHATMVFTLQDNDAPAQRWEQDLQQLQQRQHQAFAAADAPSETALTWQSAPVPERFGDEEVDLAYREYLRHREAEHNQRVRQAAQEEDVAVLLQEDWLAAQSALKIENNRRYLHARQTVVMQQNQPLQTVETHETEAAAQPPYLPPCTVHVYDLPNLPSTRRIRILSEQELINRIQEKLQIHLSNAMAGLVRQAVQKKLATLTYDLQLMLNEETEKVVRDVLEHNLAAVFRSVKDAMR